MVAAHSRISDKSIIKIKGACAPFIYFDLM